MPFINKNTPPRVRFPDQEGPTLQGPDVFYVDSPVGHSHVPAVIRQIFEVYPQRESPAE